MSFHFILFFRISWQTQLINVLSRWSSDFFYRLSSPNTEHSQTTGRSCLMFPEESRFFSVLFAWSGQWSRICWYGCQFQRVKKSKLLISNHPSRSQVLSDVIFDMFNVLCIALIHARARAAGTSSHKNRPTKMRLRDFIHILNGVKLLPSNTCSKYDK